ncbi:MAG: hypothetical protein J6Y93_06255, partial [Treponema sp.]|nr:hypothetical protein [Treponema sp.]
MKKFFTAICSSFVLLSVLMMAGCGKKVDVAYADMGLDPDVEYSDYEYIAPENFFDLDYRGEMPEPETPYGKLDLSTKAGGEGSDASVVPGLRDLKDYATSYQTKRLSKEEYLAALAKNAKEGREITYADKKRPSETSSAKTEEKKAEKEESEDTEKGDLFVKDWGPQGSVPGEVNRAQFYIEFSLPVKALTALDDQDKINKEAKKIFTITPEIKGNYHWYGTKNLSFEADETLDPCIPYVLTVNEGVRSNGGKALTGTTTFTTKTAEARLVAYSPAVTKDSNNSGQFSSDSGYPKEAAKDVKLLFNYTFSADDVYSRIAVTIRKDNESDWRELGYSVQGDYDSGSARISSDKKKTNTFYMTINDKIENESTIKISFNTGSRVANYTYKTLVPFRVVEAEDYSGRSYGAAVRFKFNQPVNRNTFLQGFQCSTQTLTDDNFSFWRNEVTMQYLNLTPGERSKVSVNTNLKNVYGFNLTDSREVSIKGKDYQGYARYIDSGNVIMEAQFPHKLLFEYMNATRGSYRISSTSYPLDVPDWDSRYRYGDSGSIYVDTSSRNTRQFVEIDLEPYLENGRGSVRFESDVRTSYVNWRGEDDENRNTNFLNVQVTDLAATARFGINKAVVMVRSMQNNTPVAGAKVYLSNRRNSLHTATVETDADGLAQILLTPQDQSTFSEWADQNTVVVNVSTDTDSVMFIPTTHSTWADGVYTDGVHRALTPVQRTFMFCDRG